MRMGKNRQPYYRIIVAEGRSKRETDYQDKLGYYQPLGQPPVITLDKNKYLDWLNKGAQPTATVASLFKRLYGRAG